MELFVMWLIYSFLPIVGCAGMLIYNLYQRSTLQAEPDYESMPKRRRSAAKKAHQTSKNDVRSSTKAILIILALVAVLSAPFALDAVLDTDITVVTSEISCRQTRTGGGSVRRADRPGFPYYSYSINADGRQRRLQASFDYSLELGYDFDSGVEYKVTYYRFTKTIKSIEPVTQN